MCPCTNRCCEHKRSGRTQCKRLSLKIFWLDKSLNYMLGEKLNMCSILFNSKRRVKEGEETLRFSWFFLPSRARRCGFRFNNVESKFNHFQASKWKMHPNENSNFKCSTKTEHSLFFKERKKNTNRIVWTFQNEYATFCDGSSKSNPKYSISNVIKCISHSRTHTFSSKDFRFE